MGACGSTEVGEDVEQKKRSQMIDKKLEEDSRRLRRECKILLLGKAAYDTSTEVVALIGFKGSGESGKSTIVKQMKIIHQNGYTQDELSLYRLTIYKNLVDCMKALTGAMEQFGELPSDENVREMVNYINEYNVDPDPHTSLDPKAAEAVEAIWHDDVIPKVMEHQSEFYMMDSAP
jgi:guanine nucleotide-binding protein G(i) subunit alpha